MMRKTLNLFRVKCVETKIIQDCDPDERFGTRIVEETNQLESIAIVPDGTAMGMDWEMFEYGTVVEVSRGSEFAWVVTVTHGSGCTFGGTYGWLDAIGAFDSGDGARNWMKTQECASLEERFDDFFLPGTSVDMVRVPVQWEGP